MKLKKMMCAALAAAVLVCMGCKDTDDSEPIPEYLQVVGTAVVGFRADIPADISIPNGITAINDAAFADCDRIQSVSIPRSVTYIGERAFYDCDCLENITMGGGVTFIGKNAFDGCGSLESIAIPSSVTEIGTDAFSGCSSLEEVYITDMTKWLGISFGNSSSNPLYYADKFYLNNMIVHEIAIPGSLTEIDFVALNGYGSKLTGITVDSSNTAYSSLDGILYNKDRTKIIYVPSGISGTVTIPSSMTAIGAGVFEDCTFLASVTIPSSVTSIGGYAFYNCTSLENVYYNGTLSQWMTIEKGWYAIPEGASIICNNGSTLPPYLTVSGTSITGYNEGMPADIVIPYGVTSIGDYAFEDCTSLASVTIPSSVTSIGDYAFRDCTSLESVTIPSSVTEIGSNAFYNCTSLNAVYITNMADWLAITFGGVSANPLCYALLYLNYEPVRTVYIPYGVARINDCAFYGYSLLESVMIPSSVTEIGSYAFYDCASLTDVFYDGTIEQWNVVSKGYSHGLNLKTIHCIDGEI